MEKFTKSLFENNMMLKLPPEYAEYLQSAPGEINFHDPENEEQAKIAAKRKRSHVTLLSIADIVLLLIFIYVIVTKNQFIVIFLMGVITFISIVLTVKTIKTKVQVAIGRAVIKIRKCRSGKKRSYLYTVAVAVDEPKKAIHSGILVSRKDYKKIQEGTRIMIINIGKAVVLD